MLKLEKHNTSLQEIENTVLPVPESGPSLIWERDLQEGAEEQRSSPLALVQHEARPPVELEPNSIAHLMQRLELGLARRELSAEVPSVTEPVWQTEPAKPPAIDDRLRSAIADLQKLAARSG